MNYPYPTFQSLQVSPLATEQSRQRLITAIISSGGNNAQFSQPYEKQLLAQFSQGRLTIDEVVYYLETR